MVATSFKRKNKFVMQFLITKERGNVKVKMRMEN